MLTPEEKEKLQEVLLRLCSAASRFGLPLNRLLLDCEHFAFDGLTKEEIEVELIVLEKEGLLSLVGKVLRPDQRRWTTTAAGNRWLMEHGHL